MKTWLILFVIVRSTVALCIELPDESVMTPLVKDLKSEKPEVREQAAAALRKIAASNQKVVEQAGEYWKEKVALIKSGMTREEIFRIVRPRSVSSLHKGSDSSVYTLDYHWEMIFVFPYSESDRREPVIVNRKEMFVWVMPPKTFTGIWTWWYANGQKASESEYKEGRRDGLLLSYDDDGNKSHEQQYANDQFNGYYLTWHKNGQKHCSGQFSNGKKDGTWTWWSANGSKVGETSFKDDVFDGPDLSWFEDGKHQYEATYKDGKLVGLESAWGESGK